MEISFEGERALVTGGANGIGRTIAERLAASGSKVFVLDKNEKDLKSLKQQFPEIEVVHTDLMNFRDAEEKIRKCLPLDLLVNNAGIIMRKSILDHKPEDIDIIFQVNYKACFLTAQIIIKDLIERKRDGSIVNIGSCHGTLVDEYYSIYSNSKAALNSLTKSLALECGPHKIRVNCVSPYGLDTDMTRPFGVDFSKPRVVKRFENLVPLRSILTKDDIADSVLFLLSNKASKITGAVLPVDCGFDIAGHCISKL